MLAAVAALLFHFSILTPNKIQALGTARQPAVGVEAVAPLVVSGDSESAAPSGTNETLSAGKCSAENEAVVTETPGRPVAEPVPLLSPAPAASAGNPTSVVAIESAPIAPLYRPNIKAASDHRQNREWLALSIVAHGAAGFDAWSTRLVISSVPQAQEANPLLRPFAGNASMYVAVQAMPTILDLLGRKMMHSQHPWARHTWWLPQAISTVASLGSGIQNMGVYNSR